MITNEVLYSASAYTKIKWTTGNSKAPTNSGRKYQCVANEIFLLQECNVEIFEYIDDDVSCISKLVNESHMLCKLHCKLLNGV